MSREATIWISRTLTRSPDLAEPNIASTARGLGPTQHHRAALAASFKRPE